MRPIFIMVKCAPGTAYDVAATALDTVEQVSEVSHAAEPPATAHWFQRLLYEA